MRLAEGWAVGDLANAKHGQRTWSKARPSSRLAANPTKLKAPAPLAVMAVATEWARRIDGTEASNRQSAVPYRRLAPRRTAYWAALDFQTAARSVALSISNAHAHRRSALNSWLTRLTIASGTIWR